MTVEALRGWGADTREGLARCMNNEALYLRLVGMLAKETQFAKMRQAVAEGKLQEAFEAAHALKGVLANLALTPLYTPVCEITELLRAKTETAAAKTGQVIRTVHARTVPVVFPVILLTRQAKPRPMISRDSRR